MGALKAIAGLLAIAFLLSTSPPGRTAAQFTPPQSSVPQPRSLFSQSAARILEREFSDPALSFLLLDARTGALLSSRWDDPAKPIPLGSLVKPFTALAYAENHEFHYPVLLCRGKATGCWQDRSHGRLDIISAVALSCNSYFRTLAEDLTGAQMLPTAARFGFEGPQADSTGAPLMGLGENWQISPLKMARAYLELYRRRDEPGVRELLAGMAQAARMGTGAGVGRALKHSDALVKTGTAQCTHQHPAPGDGFVVALVPADQPELLLMVRVHSVPGAVTARTAGRMLKRLEE